MTCRDAAMWIRRTSEEIAEAKRRRERTELLWRLNPLLPLVFTAFGFLLQGYRPHPETPPFALFVGVYLFLYAVQFFFGPGVAAIFMLGDSATSPSSSAAICPVCQCVQRPAPTGKDCELCGAALEPLEQWKWREDAHAAEDETAPASTTALRDVRLPDP